MKHEAFLARFQALVEALTGRTRYAITYSSKVVAQDPATGTLDVVPDDTSMPPLQGVPIRAGLPGVAIEVDPGARVNIAFENADPTRPIATVWDASTARLSFNGPLRVTLQPIARVGDTAKTGFLSGNAGPYPVSFVVTPTAPPAPADGDGNPIPPPAGASFALQLVATIDKGAEDLKA